MIFTSSSRTHDDSGCHRQPYPVRTDWSSPPWCMFADEIDNRYDGGRVAEDKKQIGRNGFLLHPYILNLSLQEILDHRNIQEISLGSNSRPG